MTHPVAGDGPGGPGPGALPSASDDPATQLAKKREYIAKQQRCLPSCCQAANSGLHSIVGIQWHAASTVEASHNLDESDLFMVALLMWQVAPVLAALRKVPGAGEQLPVRAVVHRREAAVAPHPHVLRDAMRLPKVHSRWITLRGPHFLTRLRLLLRPCLSQYSLCWQCESGAALLHLTTWLLCHGRCVASRELLKHHQKCNSSACPVCTPVKQYVQKQRQNLTARMVRRFDCFHTICAQSALHCRHVLWTTKCTPKLYGPADSCLHHKQRLICASRCYRTRRSTARTATTRCGRTPMLAPLARCTTRKW
jgi:hypothetical protein